MYSNLIKQNEITKQNTPQPEELQQFSISLFLQVAEGFFSQPELKVTSQSPLKDSLSDIESLTAYESEDQFLFSTIQTTASTTQESDTDICQCFHAKNSNLMKNILKSFQRFIENEKDPENQRIYCDLARVSYSYYLKSQGKRWNMKAKNMLEKSNLKPLFCYYLQNINRFWLDDSKVVNKKEHLKLINYLINYIKNPTQCEEIRFYQKRKSIIKKMY